MTFFIYILQCSNGAYYVGHTRDVYRRLKEHNSGKGALYTRENRPVTLLYIESFEFECDAIRREMQVKRWSRSKKCSLIAGDIKELKALAKRRT